MAALNPFFDDTDEEEDTEEDKNELTESSVPLPDPVKATSDTGENNEESTVDKDNDNSSSERQDDQDVGDMLEIEVNQTEFEELGGKDADKEDEDIEIISEANSRLKRTNITLASKAFTDNEDQVRTVLAKLVQFNKTGSYVTKGKVKSGILEVLEGEHMGKKGTFQVGCCYVWGYHLANANLMYHLRSGDNFHVSVTVKEGVDVDEAEVPLLIKKAWLGVKCDTPVISADNLEFSAWLIQRNITEEQFLLWITDKLPPKPFFPLKSDVYEAKVIMLIRENPKGDGALVRIVKEGDMKDNLAVFERDDFYLCGVHVGEADMRFLIRPGDSVNIQVKELSEREKKARCKKYPKLEEFEFNYTCLLAYTGDIRPRGPNLKPGESHELKTFLDQKGMSVEEFEQMRNIADDDMEIDTEADLQPPGTCINVKPAGTSNIVPLTSVSSQSSTTSLPASAPSVIQSGMGWLLNQPPNPPFPLPGTFPLPTPVGAQPFPLPTPVVSQVIPHPTPSSFPLQGSSTPVQDQHQCSSENAEKITKCTALITKAIAMKSSGNVRFSDLLVTEEDFELGYFLADILTAALVSGVQKNKKNKLFDKMGTGSEAVLGSMTRQLEMVNSQMINRPKPVDIIQTATNVALTASKPASQAMLEAQQKTLAALQV